MRSAPLIARVLTSCCASCRSPHIVCRQAKPERGRLRSIPSRSCSVNHADANVARLRRLYAELQRGCRRGAVPAIAARIAEDSEIIKHAGVRINRALALEALGDLDTPQAVATMYRLVQGGTGVVDVNFGNAAIHRFCRRGHYKAARRVASLMRDSDIGWNTWTFNFAIADNVRIGALARANNYVNEMLQLNVPPNQLTIRCMVRLRMRAHHLSYAVRRALRLCSVSLPASLWTTILHQLLSTQKGAYKDFIRTFDRIPSPTPEHFAVYLRQLAINSRYARVHRVLTDMRSGGIQPTEEHYALALRAFQHAQAFDVGGAEGELERGDLGTVLASMTRERVPISPLLYVRVEACMARMSCNDALRFAYMLAGCCSRDHARSLYQGLMRRSRSERREDLAAALEARLVEYDARPS